MANYQNHSYRIGAELKTKIEALRDSISGNSSYATVARSAMLPYISLRKRRSGRGREDDLMRIEEGITIVPMKSVWGPGSNERDGVGYRFLIAIAQGTMTDEFEEGWSLPVWEQAIRQRFQNRRVGGLVLGCSDEIRCTVDYGELPDWAMLREGLDSTYLVLTDYIREARVDVS